MKSRLLKLPFAAALALALLFGQFVALEHGLGHAFEAIQVCAGESCDGHDREHDLGIRIPRGLDHDHDRPGKPAEPTCDSHFACSQLAGAAAISPPVVPVPEPAALPQPAVSPPGASQATRLAYRSRAPPDA